MKEARNVLIVIAILLFVLIGTGVAISRIAQRSQNDTETPNQEETTDNTENEGGFLSNLFFGSRDEDESSETSENGDDDAMVIISDSDDVDTSDTPKTLTGSTDTDVPTQGMTKGGVMKNEPVVTPTPIQQTKGGQEIPATGTSTMYLVLASLALISGVYVKLESRS